MRQFIIFLGLFFVLTSCKQTGYDYNLENKILDCFYQHYHDINIDVEDIIDRIENVLVKHKILENNSGESYIQVIEQIRNNNDLKIDNERLLADINSIDNIPSSIFCRDSVYLTDFDSVDMVNSKIKYIVGIFDSIRIKGDISPTLIAEEILEVFTAQDFENDYYRTVGVVMFASLIKMNEYEIEFAKRLPIPTKEEESDKIEEHNILTVLVNKENAILADGNLIEISNLKEVVKKFILESSDNIEIDLPLIGKQMSSQGEILLQNDRGISYELYITVQNELIKAFEDIKNSYSKKFFNSTFDNLEKEKQKIIKDLVPLRISEAEPKNVN